MGGRGGHGWVSLRETMQWSVEPQASMSTSGLFFFFFFSFCSEKQKSKKFVRTAEIPNYIPQSCRAIV